MLELPCNKNCGLCCWIQQGLFIMDCKYLDENKRCTIYDTRIGTEIAPGVYCGYRKDSKMDYKNCPYNAGKQILR